jgi:hypothetical protein
MRGYLHEFMSVMIPEKILEGVWEDGMIARRFGSIKESSQLTQFLNKLVPT